MKDAAVNGISSTWHTLNPTNQVHYSNQVVGGNAV